MKSIIEDLCLWRRSRKDLVVKGNPPKISRENEKSQLGLNKIRRLEDLGVKKIRIDKKGYLNLRSKRRHN